SVNSTSSTLAPATGTIAANSRCNLNAISTNRYVTEANETCIDISLATNVSTSMLADINAPGVSCKYLTANQDLRLPGVCEIHLVQPNDTCASILSGLSRQVLLPISRAWNPSINSQCSNLAWLEGGYICLSVTNAMISISSTIVCSPPGTMPVPTGFPLNVANSTVFLCAKTQYFRSAVPTNAVGRSNTRGQTVATGTPFKESIYDFYFLNPQLGGSCSDLWEGNSYCVETVGNVQSYSGYSTTTRSLYTTLASTINLNVTATRNETIIWLLPTTATYPTTTGKYNITAINLTKNYTLCSQAMKYFNISLEDVLTSEMLDNTAWMTEYDRVCLLGFSQPLPTRGFNTSISFGSSTAYHATSTSHVKHLSTAITISTTTATESTLLSSTGSTTSSSSAALSTSILSISPDGTCSDTYGYTCAGSQFGDCCDKWGYW
ncbi:hypothetical protein N7504_011722, partial [Penicillium tannophilum]